MRTKMFPVAAAALIALTPLASMARTTGYFSDAVVKSVNPSALTVTLKDGTRLGVETASQFNQLKPGQRYNIKWADVGGNATAVRVQKVS